ncbi:Lrp/AsnC family transcriptional regulator [Bacteroidota bacterium]
MNLKLDKKDWKILDQLDINCRQSDAEIGKKVRLSKQVVNYRIKKLVDNNIITGFVPHFNTAKLGYGIHKIYIQLKSLRKEKEQEMWKYLTEHPNLIWIVSCSGKWNLIFAIAAKDVEHFDSILTKFMNKYSEFILNRAVTVFNKATLHHRKWLVNNRESLYWLLGGKVEEPIIDDIDWKILFILSNNAREPLIKIAQSVGISNSLTLQRIKKLQKKEIIGTFRISIDREKLRINYCKSFVYYQNKTSENEEQLLRYCRQLPQIFGVSQSIGSWDLELEFEVRDYDEFHKIMKEMKNKFPLVRSFDTVYIETEFGQTFLPRESL